MTHPVFDRMIVDGSDPEAWRLSREGRIGASDAAGFAKLESADKYAIAKLHAKFSGNAYTKHGHAREVAILRAFGVEQNLASFHAEGNELHSCTPDGFKINVESGEIILIQAKTSKEKTFLSVPIGYRRQMQWEMYVMGAQRSLFAWETYTKDYRRISMEPESIIVERDDEMIDGLITIATEVLRLMALITNERKALQS